MVVALTTKPRPSHRLVTDSSGKGEGMSHDQRGVTIPEAAQLLGISENAVRMRIRRQKLNTYRTGDRVYVLVDDQANDRPSRPSHDQVTDQGSDQQRTERELIEQLKSENAFLRAQLEARDRQTEVWAAELQQRRLDMARLESRMLDVPQDAQESPEPHDPGYVYREPEPAKKPWWKMWRRG
jgi:hypothetical protein